MVLLVIVGRSLRPSDGRIVAPRPETTSDLEIPLNASNSTLTLPVRVELGALLDEVEAEIPTGWGDLEERMQVPDNDRAEVAIALTRGPFSAAFEDERARLSATISYGVRLWYDLPVLPDPRLSCGAGEDEPRPRLFVELEGPVSLTEEWRLSTRTAVGQLGPATEEERDRCEVSIVGFDVTDRVVGAARSFLEGHLDAIDSLTAEADLRPHFEEWWDILRDPIGLDDNIWLELRPIAISRGAVRGEGELVEIMATLTARPQIVLGEEPPSWGRPLPDLGSGTDTEGLSILVDAVAEYDEASARLTEVLRGFTLERAGREVVVRSLAVSGIGGGRVALEVEIEGDVSGRLFLVGTPEYDTEAGQVSVPDLSFAISTSNLFVSGASWIADAGLEAVLRERARWPVDTAVGWASDKLAEGLNRELADGVRLRGTVGSLEILGVTALREGMFVRAAARAQASLTIDENA